MSIIDGILESVRKGLFNNGAGFLNGEEDKKHLAVLTEWYYMAYKGMGTPRRENLTFVREIAKTAACRIVIDTILSEIRSTEHVVRPKDKEAFNEGNLDIVKNFIAKPNFNGESIDDIIQQFANDILEVDAGVIVNVFDRQGWLGEIYARDGASFLVNVDIFGTLPISPAPAYFQYSYKYPAGAPLPFTRDEVCYAKLHPKSYSAYGWSPVQSIKVILEALNNSFDWNRLFFENRAIPDGGVSVLNTDPNGLNRFKAIWNKELKGQPHKMMFWNQEMKFTPFSPTAKEMEFLSSQQWYLRLVATTFGVSANEIALTSDVNRATAGSQERINVKRALRPVLEKVEDVLTKQVIPHLKGADGKPITDIEFKFLHVDPSEEEQKRINEDRDLKNRVVSINEVRSDRGMDPAPWGNEPQAPFSPTLNDVSERFRQEKERDEASKKKFQGTVEKAPKMVQDARHYDEIISDMLKAWLSKIMTMLDKAREDWLNAFKTTMPTPDEYNRVQEAVRRDFAIGIQAAEKELDLDIGYTSDLSMKADAMTAEQLYGYSLPDGQVWPGIKGFTSDMTSELTRILESAMSSHEPLAKVKDKVADAFSVSASRAETIARTETNRIINQGRISSWKEVGVKGKMKWNTLKDERTSDICRRLDGQEVLIGSDFIDPSTGQRFKGPPAHPNCRSFVTLEAEE